MLPREHLARNNLVVFVGACLRHARHSSSKDRWQAVRAVYLTRLVECLDKTELAWRTTHVLVIDYAPCHRSEITQRVMSSLKIPKCLTAPASYVCLPVKRIFVILRSKEYDLATSNERHKLRQQEPKEGFLDDAAHD